MSIKKSLRISILLAATVPLVLLTILAYTVSYFKYVELAKNTATNLASDYADGFETQLNGQIAEIEGLSHASSIQNLALESYNGVASGIGSAYYGPAMQLLSDTSGYTNNNISYYVYDINGYFIASSSDEAPADWEEYMDTPVSGIIKTRILKSSNINQNHGSIDVVTPIIVKDKIIGLVRANISSAYFGDFIPTDGAGFVMTEDDTYLFSSAGFAGNSDLEHQAKQILASDKTSGYLEKKHNSVKDIYGYSKIDQFGWLYLYLQDGTRYEKILATLPRTLIVTLIVISVLAFIISNLLAKRFTEPIITLKDTMTESSRGNLDLRSDIRTNNELGELSDMFNNMMDIISNNYKELSSSKLAIEEKQKELEENYIKIEQLAYHDGLTGLYNRVAFMKYSYERFHDNDTIFLNHAILFIDLDNFKTVNDTLGHDYGDLLLQNVSNQLTASINETDILSRTGGDEFLIMTSDFESKEELATFAESLVEIVRQPFDLKGETASVSMSVGIAIFPQDGLTITELIKNADIAMYNAKNSGKNAYRFFDSSMEEDVTRKSEIAEVLSHVIENNEIYLEYQPQVNVRTGQITGYEALMRVKSDSYGPISPGEFIPIAEDTGIISQLGEWALIEACHFNRELVTGGYGRLNVSVNISATQFKNGKFLQQLSELPDITGIDLSLLEIEINANTLDENFEANVALLEEIKRLGCKIALDDFGTGYASFNYLTKVPMDTLKIDKSFIDGINKSEKNKYIADSIITLAHKMNINVVAEGVEDTTQLQVLQTQLCDTLQGYIFSEPLDSKHFIELLSKNKHL